MNSGKSRDPSGCWVERTDPPTAGAARSDETLHLKKNKQEHKVTIAAD